jgi:uncharacterized protein
MKGVNSLFIALLIGLIKLYQRSLSPDHGPRRLLYPFGYCRYHPTCSEYAIDALRKHGLVGGGLKTVWRLLRCNPFSKGGYDPVV